MAGPGPRWRIDRRALTRAPLWRLAVIASGPLRVESSNAVDGSLPRGRWCSIPALAISWPSAGRVPGRQGRHPPRPKHPLASLARPGRAFTPPWWLTLGGGLSSPVSSRRNDSAGSLGRTRRSTVVLTVATFAAACPSRADRRLACLAARDECRLQSMNCLQSWGPSATRRGRAHECRMRDAWPGHLARPSRHRLGHQRVRAADGERMPPEVGCPVVVTIPACRRSTEWSTSWSSNPRRGRPWRWPSPLSASSTLCPVGGGGTPTIHRSVDRSLSCGTPGAAGCKPFVARGFRLGQISRIRRHVHGPSQSRGLVHLAPNRPAHETVRSPRSSPTPTCNPAPLPRAGLRGTSTTWLAWPLSGVGAHVTTLANAGLDPSSLPNTEVSLGSSSVFWRRLRIPFSRAADDPPTAGRRHRPSANAASVRSGRSSPLGQGFWARRPAGVAPREGVGRRPGASHKLTRCGTGRHLDVWHVLCGRRWPPGPAGTHPDRGLGSGPV